MFTEGDGTDAVAGCVQRGEKMSRRLDQVLALLGV
jgi:hypothetical protein